MLLLLPLAHAHDVAAPHLHASDPLVVGLLVAWGLAAAGWWRVARVA
jgi:hypothetical protein